MPQVQRDDGKIDLLVFRARRAPEYVSTALLLGRPVGRRRKPRREALIMTMRARVQGVLPALIGLSLAAGCAVPQPPAMPMATSTSSAPATALPARPTNSITPSPTRIRLTDTPRPTPTPDLAEAALRVEDLPPGFETIDPLALGLDPAGLEPHGLRVQRSFAFMHPLQFQFVVGSLSLLGSTTDRFVFDSLAASPRVVAEALVGSAELLVLDDVRPLDFPALGDNPGAISAKLHAAGVVFHTELVMFREDSVGAVLVVARLDGDLPIVTLSDMARVLLARIRNA